MLNRIPHISEAIEGEARTRDYVERHARHARVQFGAFMAELQRQITQRQARGRFLEIGCGPGFLTAMMAEEFPYAEMNALELSTDMIAIAREVVCRTQHPSRVRFIPGSVDDRTLMAHLGKFDLVYSTFSLHHWEHPVRAIRSMHKALAKEGLMVLHDFKRVPWLYLLPGQGGFIQSIRASYRPREIQGMMRAADIQRYEMRTRFPYFWHTVLAAA